MVSEPSSAAAAAAQPVRDRGVLFAGVMAASVAIFVAGELGTGLVAAVWSVGHLMGLPLVVSLAVDVVAVAIALYVGVLLFVRTFRVERRLARGESCEDLPWQIWPSAVARASKDTP